MGVLLILLKGLRHAGKESLRRSQRSVTKTEVYSKPCSRSQERVSTLKTTLPKALALPEEGSGEASAGRPVSVTSG